MVQNNNKIKVVWISQFSNPEVREKLDLSKRRVFVFLKSLLYKNKRNYRDFASWITVQLKEFEKIKNVELHVISPHQGMKQMIKEFEINGIYYHFYKSDLFSYLEILRKKLFKKSKCKYVLNRFNVKKIIDKLNPDIVNLIGAENPYYSITALDVKSIPVYVLLQTVLQVSLENESHYDVSQERLYIEKQIFMKMKYFGTFNFSKLYFNCVKKMNTSANILNYYFPRTQPICNQEVKKEFDFVFFAAGVSNVKGIEDTLEALSIVNKKGFYSTLNIIGSCSGEYKKILQNKISELDIEDKVFFNDYFPEHSDVFKQIQKANIAVLPSKIDVISSTITEAMFMQIPVVAYKTSGTPFLNKEMEAILLSDIGDINSLADNMIKLLQSEELRKEISENALKISNKYFDSKNIAEKLVQDYYAIIDHYHHNKEIPPDLLV
ncbi:MAG: glycosyltransferase [Candidatus Nanoarchaeia archaeon]|nr:glycosyltransferase [Candidatus Nanoarchaeia archaeon]